MVILFVAVLCCPESPDRVCGEEKENIYQEELMEADRVYCS